MRKLEEKKLREGGKVTLIKSTVEAGGLYSDTYGGIMGGSIIISSEPFNNSIPLSMIRGNSADLNIPKVMMSLVGITPPCQVSIFEDNHDIIIIPTNREKETLRELGVKLY